jgi:protein gp37
MGSEGMNETGISWTDYTLNPLTGCTKISEGCDNCYASALYERHGWSFEPTMRMERLADIEKIPSGSKVFLGSVTDIFHDYFMSRMGVSLNIIFDAIEKRKDVIFQILTKRPWNALTFFEKHGNHDSAYRIPPHIWIGVSAENKRWLQVRMSYLEKIPAKIKFLSCEPLLEDLTLMDSYGDRYCMPLESGHVKWLIVGAESGSHRRPFSVQWAKNLKEVCDRFGIAFWYKQGSGFKPGQDHEINGESYMEFPRD